MVQIECLTNSLTRSLRSLGPTYSLLHVEKGEIEAAQSNVEDLLREIESMPANTINYELWVANVITLKGNPIPLEIGMAIILDKMLEKEMYPGCFSETNEGRLYRYANN